jgi:tRNA(Ile2) C34 agmatinyltransferase TiaS
MHQKKNRTVLNVKAVGTYGYHCPSKGYRASEDQARKKTRQYMHQKQIYEIKILAHEHFSLIL